MILRFIFGSNICFNSGKNGHATNENKRGKMEKKGKGRPGQGRVGQDKMGK